MDGLTESYARVRWKGDHHREAKASVQIETHHWNIVIGLRVRNVESNVSGTCNREEAIQCGIWLIWNVCICVIYITVFPLKLDVPCKNCTRYKIMTMTFWRDWRLPTPLES
jgi:hypothetical protein